ncbi:ABC transporter permease [Alteromonas pelagimontana]|uniref:ABC transporter permease n=2 Tax=Alteromonas pelagimontana TaxID=1858656 RepID=A0A6M4MI45_9ALTE|nr:ABC transporter permease [Alteromonas pelagimontana]
MPTLQPAQQLGLALVLMLLIFALGEGAFYAADPNTQQLAKAFSPPSTAMPLGADQFGRDMFARLGAALRLSFLLSALCVATSAITGVAAGICAAWAGGVVEKVLNFVVNTILALPGLVLVLLFAAIVPGSFIMLYLAISLTLWVEYFRLVRATAKPLINGPQLQSSMLLSFGRWYCFRRHIWPAIAPDVCTLAAFGAATSIITMASVGFVYVGLQPPTAELGLMIVELFSYYSDAPWLLAQPLIALFLMVLGFHLLAGKKTL